MGVPDIRAVPQPITGRSLVASDAAGFPLAPVRSNATSTVRTERQTATAEIQDSIELGLQFAGFPIPDLYSSFRESGGNPRHSSRGAQLLDRRTNDRQTYGFFGGSAGFFSPSVVTASPNVIFTSDLNCL